jgi:hypothetical protein
MTDIMDGAEFVCPTCVAESAEWVGTFTLTVGADAIPVDAKYGELVWEGALRDGRVLNGRMVDGRVEHDPIGPYAIPSDATLVCDNDATHEFGVEVAGDRVVYRFWPLVECDVCGSTEQLLSVAITPKGKPTTAPFTACAGCVEGYPEGMATAVIIYGPTTGSAPLVG